MSAVLPLRSGTWSSVRWPPRLVIFATSPLRLVRVYKSTGFLLDYAGRALIICEHYDSAGAAHSGPEVLVDAAAYDIDAYLETSTGRPEVSRTGFPFITTSSVPAASPPSRSFDTAVVDRDVDGRPAPADAEPDALRVGQVHQDRALEVLHGPGGVADLDPDDRVDGRAQRRRVQRAGLVVLEAQVPSTWDSATRCGRRRAGRAAPASSRRRRAAGRAWPRSAPSCGRPLVTSFHRPIRRSTYSLANLPFGSMRARSARKSAICG